MSAIRLVTKLENGSALLIEQTSEGFFLYERRLDDSQWDTWHLSVDEAKEQAAFTHGVSEEDWRKVPFEVGDWVKFARGSQN